MNENRLQQIIEGCRQNEHGAQQRLYHQYYQFTFHKALQYTSSLEEAREIVNDVFLKVFKKIQDYNPAQAFKSWLAIITTYTAIDYYRKHRKGALTSDDLEAVAHKSVCPDVIARLSADELHGMVQQLSHACRSAIRLHAIEGYDHAEIAQMLHISVGTSKSNLFKARVKLRGVMRKMGGGG
ncbi:MAG: RNA polymerase sigma factor [Saprospiraceae bacterium]|nr:RNA polymerase sigma factor [Saprospiraceae bacterium]